MKHTSMLILLTAVFFVGCSQQSKTETGKACDDPNAYQVLFETSKGNFIIEVCPSWAPKAAQRFRELVESGYYDGCRFFRVIPHFVVQFGINGDPKVTAQWVEKRLKDEPVLQSNKRGYVAFAAAGPDSRTTQVFINLKNNDYLDDLNFTPFGRVISGMDVVDSIESKYRGVADQARIETEGNKYLQQEFPDMDYIIRARILDSNGRPIELKKGQPVQPATQEKQQLPKEPQQPQKQQKPQSGKPQQAGKQQNGKQQSGKQQTGEPQAGKQQTKSHEEKAGTATKGTAEKAVSKSSSSKSNRKAEPSK